jgi:hypothetical protein
MNYKAASYIVLTLLYPTAGEKIVVNTQSIVAISHNMATEKSQGTLVSFGGTRINVKETPEEILELMRKAEQKQ